VLSSKIKLSFASKQNLKSETFLGSKGRFLNLFVYLVGVSSGIYTPFILCSCKGGANMALWEKRRDDEEEEEE